MHIGAILDLHAVVRRTDLENKLKRLGWSASGPSGANHTAWRHRRRRGVIAVPDVDILLDSVAERLIAEAGG